MAYHHEVGAPSPALLRLLGIVTLIALAPLLVLAWLRAFLPVARPARVRDLRALRLDPAPVGQESPDRQRRLAS